MTQKDLIAIVEEAIDSAQNPTVKIGTYAKEKKSCLRTVPDSTDKIQKQFYQGKAWPSAQYIILCIDDKDAIDNDECIRKWSIFAKKLDCQQFLIIETSKGEWQMLDGQSNIIAKDNTEVTNYFACYTKNSALQKPFIQRIYFGAPGSGKSNKVKKIVVDHEKDTFRTTFHPDTDYASFVGSYKPVMTASYAVKLSGSLTENDLADVLRTVTRGSNIKVALTQFGIEYSGYFNGKIASYSKEVVVTKAGLSSAFKTELNTAVKLAPWVEANCRNEQISYEFVPQAFTDAYVRAWQNLEIPVYLVIEEINRGNCAQIFGDLFQLLDRGPDGKSEYPVKADKDLCRYLETVLGADHEGIKDGNLRLPANLNIIATMNTSDQSLFPMDSAFKRRWDWEYVPIDPENPDSKEFTISIDEDKKYPWKGFLKAANEHIKDVSESEDKQMGNFFIKGNIGRKEFISKVMFYLWSEVCKEEYRARSFFRSKDDFGKETEFSFNELFEKDSAGACKDVSLLQGFMSYLGVSEKKEE